MKDHKKINNLIKIKIQKIFKLNTMKQKIVVHMNQIRMEKYYTKENKNLKQVVALVKIVLDMQEII